VKGGDVAVAAKRAVSRNDPCPCGSGRRFKDCHGSLRGDAPAAPLPPRPVRRSRYRPAGNDWTGLDDDEQDRLGALMEVALAHQRAGRVREAESAYRAVLEQAPRTHDALHMLGVVRLGLGDFPDAERLIREARALRPSYPAIETNWSLVQRTIAARDRSGVEILAEHALPLLCARIAGERSALPSKADDAPQSLHVVGVAGEATRDAAWVSRRIGELLSGLQPTAWRCADPDAATAWQGFDAGVIDPAAGRQPLAGDVILASVECETDSWLGEPLRRVLVFVQAMPPSWCLERLRRIAADGTRPVALVFTSRAMASRFGLIDYVVPPPIDLAEFVQAADAGRASPSILRVAAVGQDGRRVIVASDAGLLQAAAEQAGELRLFDPGPLRYSLGSLPAVRCFSRREIDIGGMLRGADVYLHRALPWWAEGSGRALFGAMAQGIPVLCPRESSYAEYVDDGVDGFIYADGASALVAIETLHADRARLLAMAQAARAKANRLFEPRALASAYASVVEQWRLAA
jgi:hypothetical protein